MPLKISDITRVTYDIQQIIISIEIETSECLTLGFSVISQSLLNKLQLFTHPLKSLMYLGNMTSIIRGLLATFFMSPVNSLSILLNLLYSFVSYVLISEDPKNISSKYTHLFQTSIHVSNISLIFYNLSSHYPMSDSNVLQKGDIFIKDRFQRSSSNLVNRIFSFCSKLFSMSILHRLSL